MSKTLLLLVSLSVFFSLTSCCSTKFNYADTANNIVKQRAEVICREENLEIFGTGGGMMDNIYLVSLVFTAERKVDIPEARYLIVKIVEELLNDINTTKALQPYLNPCPFPPSGVEAGVLFSKSDGSFVDYGCSYLGEGGVSAVGQCKGKLFYSSYNKKTKRLENYYEEPYETALAIVRGVLEETVCEPITPTPSSCK